MGIDSILRRVVRNEAIRIDPPEIYNWRIVALAGAVSKTPYSIPEEKIQLTSSRHVLPVHSSE